MPDGWFETNLGEVAELKIGRTPPRGAPRYWTDDLSRPFCTIADMQDQWIDPCREGVTPLAEAEGKAKRVPAGSLLMSFKLTLGRVGYAARDLFPNEAIVWIEPRIPDIEKRFLGAWLQVQDLTTASGRAVKGNTLNGPSLRAIPVSYPPLSEQRRIVDLIEAVDRVIQLSAQVAAAGADLARSVADDYMAAEPKEILGNLAELQVGFAFKSDDFTESPSDVRLLRGDNVTPGGLRWEGAKRLPSSLAEPFGRYQLAGGDIVIPLDRPIISSGLRWAEVSPEDIPSLLVQRVARLRPPAEDARINIVAALLSGEFESYVVSRSTGGHAPHISGKDVRDFSIPAHGEGSRPKAWTAVCAIEVETAASSQAESARALRRTLLADLMSRERSIPESYDRFLEAVL